jgi:hypothetical protein
MSSNNDKVQTKMQGPLSSLKPWSKPLSQTDLLALNYMITLGVGAASTWFKKQSPWKGRKEENVAV